MTILLILGSAPSVTACRTWPRAPFDRIVAINNAWRVRPDWDDLVHAGDFPPENLPSNPAPHQRSITHTDYVPAQNRFGGFVYAGGTMAFTAAYWALDHYKPKVIAFLGCDMVYPASGQTHFYGTGRADPLRDDITLRSLEAKSARLLLLAARQGCALVNLSQGTSRLVFPRATPDALPGIAPLPGGPCTDAPMKREERLGYLVASGRYWEEAARFDPAELAILDRMWLAAAGIAPQGG